MRAWFVSILIAILAICFTLDPTPTIAEDTTDKIIDRQLCDLHFTDNNNNSDKRLQKKNVDLKHSCPNCKSSSLAFEGLSTYEGKLIQIIDCETCGYEWQESWRLPNWFWLKSSLPDSHWTSERWNQE